MGVASATAGKPGEGVTGSDVGENQGAQGARDQRGRGRKGVDGATIDNSSVAVATMGG